MASELFELPDGTAVCCNPGGKFHGWLFTRHPDGQFVSIRKLEPAKQPAMEWWVKETARPCKGADNG